MALSLKAVAALLAAVLLNAALSFHNLWPTFLVRPVAELSLDLCLGLLLLAAWLEVRRRPLGPLAQALLTLTLLILFIGRYSQVTAPALFGRELQMVWDLPHLPAVVAMSAAAEPTWFIVSLSLAALIALALLISALHHLLKLIIAACHTASLRRVTLAGCTALLMLYAVGRTSERLHYEHWFSISVVGMYAEQISLAWRARYDVALPEPPSPTVDPATLGDDDVMLVFLESYGAVVRDQQDYAAALHDAYDELANAAADNWHTASGWLRSTTFGGASWLAHASVMTGSRVDSQGLYQSLLRSDRPTLSRTFRAHGYRSVAMLPGTKKEWPEGQFYGYDKLYTAAIIDYQGPAFGWWKIPDQYSLNWLSRRELEPQPRPPLLVVFASVMSHAPFSPLPPYLPDWSRLSTNPPYTAAEHREAIAQAAERDYSQAYLQSIRYNLRTVSGYLRRSPRSLSDGALLLVLGDHQPPARISGPGATYDVPVHVFSRNRHRLAAFLEAGFETGVEPQTATVGGIEKLYSLILQAATDSP